MTLEMKKILFALTLLTLCSCGTNKIHESQGGCEYEWLSGSIGLPLSYNGVFEWGNLRDFILKNWDPKNRAEARLKRIIIKDYRIEYMDFWKFEGIGMHILPE